MTDFPSTPTLGDLHTYAGIRYRWNGSKWIIQSGTSTPKKVTSYADLDLSKGTYHKISTNEGRDITFSNIPSGSSKWSLELDINTTSKYDLSNAALTGKNLTIPDGTPRQTCFKPDGTMLFVMGYANKRIYAYDLSTAWDLSTATLSTSLDISSYDSDPIGLTFDPSGKHMYVWGNATNTIYQFELGTRWNITSANLVFSNTLVATYTRHSVRFNPDGTRLYMLGYVSSTDIRIYQYNLSTPWNISASSMSYISSSGSLHGQDSAMLSFDFNNIGTKMYAVGYANDRVYRYSLTTPWDVSTATYDSVYATLSGETTPTNMCFDTDGSRMFVSGTGSDVIREYDTTSDFVIYSGGFTFPDNVIWAQGTPPITSENDTKVLDFYSPDGGTTIYGKERYTTNAVVKASKVIPISLSLYVSAVNTWTYHEYTSRIQQYAGRSARLLFQHYGPSMQNGEGWVVGIDLVNFNNTTYSFENATQGWVTTGQNVPVGGTPFPTSTWTTPLIGTGGVSGNFAMSTAYAGLTGGGSYSAYGYAAPYVHHSAYLRSPTVILASNPSLSFYLKKDGTKTVTSAYLEILD